jgi:hypothetical protein
MSIMDILNYFALDVYAIFFNFEFFHVIYNMFDQLV